MSENRISEEHSNPQNRHALGAPLGNPALSTHHPATFSQLTFPSVHHHSLFPMMPSPGLMPGGLFPHQSKNAHGINDMGPPMFSVPLNLGVSGQNLNQDICADCANAKAKIMSNYESLMKIRADAILPGLFAKGVITSENKQIIDAKILDWEKMRYLIDNIIIQSLDVGIITTYKEFLNVLERNDDRIINTIAQRLGH